MKSLMLLWQAALEDMGAMCHVSTSLDLKKAQARFEHEGESFWTITLPSYAKALEKALDIGKVSPDLFPGFRSRGSSPLFLGGFLDLVFERSTGLLLETPSVDSIFALRQLTLMFGKILLPCSDARERGAIAKYLECEQEVKKFDQRCTEEMKNNLLRMSNLLFRDVFTVVDQMIYDGAITGKHGPGKTSDRISGNQKYDFREWPQRLEEVFPFGEHAIPNWRYRYLLDRASFLEPGAERPVKVVLVPKTLKTPRVIAMEPAAMQYMQQGIMEKLVELLESDNLVSQMIGFTEQGPNQTLAQIGSSKGLLATLDLSEASDRVSNQHVRVMLQRFPHLLGGVDATRSRKADVPGHGVIRLAKFASMGSALCFPFEAMVFLSLIFLGIEQGAKRQFARKDIKSFSGQVRVYGDDMIVPVHYVQDVIQVLESFGFQVNKGKSFWNGKFRESCGKEYYDGHDVSITRVRRVLPVSRHDVREIVSAVSLRNQLYLAGLWRAAGYLDEIITPVLKGYFPDLEPSYYVDPSQMLKGDVGRVGTSRSPLLGRVTFLPVQAERVHGHLHTPLVKGWRVSPILPASVASGEGALLKVFLKRGDQPFADRDHLAQVGS